MKSGIVAKIFAMLISHWRACDRWQKQLITLGVLMAVFVIVALMSLFSASDHLEPLKYAAALILINAALFLVVSRQAPTMGDMILLSLVVISSVTATYYLVFYLGSGV